MRETETVRVIYLPNPEFYDSDSSFFRAEYVFDLVKLEDFASMQDVNGVDHIYSDLEANEILREVRNPLGMALESHDKYSFYDTPDERDFVLMNHDTCVSVREHVVEIFLNS